MTTTRLKKIYITNNAEELVYEDRLYLLNILKQHLPEEKITENADGCRINLDSLPDEIINKLHYIMKNKLRVPITDLI